MKKGFDRLRGVATASAIGLGLLGGGSVRAATKSTSFTVTVTGANFTAHWTEIGNSNSGPCSTTTSGGDTINCGTSDNGFGINDATLTTPSALTVNSNNSYFSDLYDGGLNLSVDGMMFTNPDANVDLTGTTVTTDVMTDITAGVDAQIQYYFDPNRPVVRALYTLTNTTGSDIDVHALVSSNMGSDSETTIQDTSSGDTTWTAADQWLITNDNTTVGGGPRYDPVSTFATWGSGATVMPSIAFLPGGGGVGNADDIGVRYDVTVPANGTARILVFNDMNTTNAAASAGAADFESLAAANAAGLLTGLTPAVCSDLVNYDGTSTTCPGTSGGKSKSWWKKTFSLDMPGLLVMMGSLLWFRRRKPQA
jgi:hypothetical protein